MSKTSWSPVAKWYGGIVGDKGHYFHEHVILPKLKTLLELKPGDTVLDIGCGQGVYARTIPVSISYQGLDLSKELIAQAKSVDKNPKHEYFVADAVEGIPLPTDSIDHAVCILAIQNMKDGARVIKHVGSVLKPGGDFVVIMNHPAYRIPRQSSWGTDEVNKLEYRRVNRYLSPMEIPINAHPGLKDSPLTWTYHQPLEYYSKAYKEAGLAIVDLEEWTSDKESVGKAAKAENRARKEFPLFLAIKAVKLKL
jgi:ubiquinone/menaquinone biosynthesis C-methylase UbiE